MQILFLGTSSMVPTKERSHSSILISCKNDKILVDCGEGTQRQLKIAGKKLTKISKILVSHWHGDHVLGLPGLIQSMGASGYNKTLQIYGPVGIKKHIKNMYNTYIFDKKTDIEVNEVKSGVFFENNEFVLETKPLKHSIKTQGYSVIEKDKRKINLSYIKKLKIPEGPLLGKLQSGKNITYKGKNVDVNKATEIIKGKKITIISDTMPCNGANNLAKNSDVLISESTYSSNLDGKSETYCHMTSKQAAQLAKKTSSKQLILTHFSARYKNTQELEEDAKAYFNNVLCAKDFMKVNL